MVERYGVVYADPPWSYRDKCVAGKRGVEFKYSVMMDDAILEIGRHLPGVVLGDSLLFLWATGPRLPFAMKVVEAWGFEFKNVAFTWIKKNKKTDSLAWGMGSWTRANPEFCLLGVRGKPKRASAGVHSVVIARRMAHSSKPTEVRDRISELVGGGMKKLELFARTCGDDWDATGFEHDGVDVIDFLRAKRKEVVDCEQGEQKCVDQARESVEDVV
jgi:site-specific DNA-methyltransferase (adenine-specific)